MHSQPDDLTTVYEQFLTTDSHGYYTWKQITTTLPASQLVEENILFNTILSAMPSDMAEEFQNDDTGVLLIQTLLSQFSRNSSPSWFARLSAPARTYFMTRWLGVLRDSFDIQGTSWETLKALQVTTISDNVPTTVTAAASFQQSQEWTYMDILLSAVPEQIAILNVPGALYDRRARIASAVYDQFTSGSAPPWFTAMPKDAQSYVVQDFLPNNLEDPMTLDILALASPGSTATPAPGPTATPSAEPAHGVTSKDKAVVTGTVVPVISIGLAIAFIIWFIRRRRTKQRSRPASATHPYDIERATQRWSETTFTTTAQPLSYHTQVSPSSPGPLTVSPVSDRTASVRRTLSESDLRGGEKNLVEMGLSKSQDEPLELEAPVVPKLERRRSMSTDLRSA